MKISRDEISSNSSNPPFSPQPSNFPFEPAPPSTTSAAHVAQRAREGGRRLSTGLHRRGTRLYRITQPGGGVYWLAEALERGRVLSRCFGSELHARAWLIDLLRPARTAAAIDSEEINERFRLPALVRCG
jgi:hypothetical protein